jgi:xylan 1,4-beta-xylosidase
MNISLVADHAGSPLPHIWSRCIGSGHATLTLREDWRAQVRTARQEIGVEQVRFHGILDDEMSTSIAHGLNSWLNVDSIVDFLLSQNMSSVFELGFMPTWLVDSSYDTPTPVARRMHYKANPEPPSNYTQWGELIFSFASHLVERYGIDTMEKFPMEVPCSRAIASVVHHVELRPLMCQGVERAEH